MSHHSCKHQNHNECITQALAHASHYCKAHDLQLTTIRQRVLEILLEAHVALGAYDVLERLNYEGQNAKPPIAYRALKFLTDHGFAHRVESLNAYVACANPGPRHTPAFSVCTGCKTVFESLATPQNMPTISGFQAKKTTIEVEGLCTACQGLTP